jgi:hypothetical protein
MKIIKSIALLLLVLAGLGSFFQDTRAQDTGWTPPRSLGAGWFPDITADRSGRVHVAWASSSRPVLGSLPGEFPRGYDTVMYMNTVNGETWSESHDIAALAQDGGSEATRPALLVDDDGVFHMTFRDQTIYYARAPVLDAFSAQAWLSRQAISVNQVGYYSQLGLDSQGVLHIVFTENLRTPECAICYHVFYRRSTDNGRNWSIRSDLSRFPTGTADPRLLIDPQDNLHVVWEAGRGGANGQLSEPTTVMYSASYDGGANWTPPVEFIVPDGRAKNAVLGLDGQGNLLAAWLSLPQGLVYYHVSPDQGRTWSEPQPVPGIWGGWAVYPARLDGYSMATDSAGNVHFVLAGRRGPAQRTLEVLHLAWSNGAWAPPTALASYFGNAPEWPRIAVSGGNQLHVVWFVRDETSMFDSDLGSYTVWYAHGASQALPLGPEPFPTATPTVEPTPTVIIPTPSPTPPDPRLGRIPISRRLGDSIYTENDEVVLMAKALLPAAAVLLLALAWMAWRRG